MYKTIRRIGASQFATVSQCQSPQANQVALKEFNRQVLTPRQQETIFSAAERWKKVSLAGLVAYYEVSASQHYIAMELMDRSVAMRLREGSSDPRLVLHTLRGALAVLANLHDLGLVHINLKPTNVFFDTDGRVRLSDGLLSDVRMPTPFPSPANLKYLAPEQVSQHFGPISPATDLYCIGLLALELLAGERFARAFQGMRGDAPSEDIAWSQWHTSALSAPSANLFAKNCTDELAGVIAKLLAKQPSLRYASARHALQDLPQDLSVQAAPISRTAAAGEKKREASAAHIIARPATGVVLAIASGARAGEMIGSNENELMLGFDHDCFIRFSREQYPLGGAKVLMRRGPQGWYALRVSGDTAFVNQRSLEEKCPLRSGDIVRLSPRGPDVQFTMQSGGVAIRSLVERFLPQASPRATVGSPAASGAAQPITETAPAESKRGASAVGPKGTVVAKPNASGTVVSASQLAAATGGQVESSGGTSPHLSSQASNQASNFLPHVVYRRLLGYLPWLDPRTWPSTLRNIAIGILGALVVILLAGLLTRRPPARSTSDDSSSPTKGPLNLLLDDQQAGKELVPESASVATPTPTSTSIEN